MKKRTPYTSKQITNVRSGRHQCFDRLVIHLNGHGEGMPGYHVKYVKTVTQDGSGDNVPLRGGASLRVIVKAPAYDDDGRLTYRPGSWRDLVDVWPVTEHSARSHGRGPTRGKPLSGSE